jgi:acyl-CoA synthetase (NDP forming)
MGREGLPAGLAELQDTRIKARIPAYIFPESAARALAAMWQFRRALSRPEGRTVSFDTGDDSVTRIIDATLQAGHTKLSEPDALRILEAYGIPTLQWRFVSQQGTRSLAPQVVEAAAELEFPVALKIVSPQVTHKTDVGGVLLGLRSKAEVERAVREMVKRVEGEKESGAKLDGILVQQMASGGTETIVGMTRVEGAGALVMFGMGGIYVEVMKDVVLRLVPLLDTDAHAMVRQVKMYKLLEGVRGEPPRDLAALSEAILRISQLAERHPRITEMDINPLIALEQGTIAIDARVQVSEQ